MWASSQAVEHTLLLATGLASYQATEHTWGMEVVVPFLVVALASFQVTEDTSYQVVQQASWAVKQAPSQAAALLVIELQLSRCSLQQLSSCLL